ncbi:MAG: SH3 domain-containing protein [Dehalococcoidia bacterium]
MGGTDLRAHVVTPDQLSEAERRLYDLARASTPLAEIGVRLGLPVSEVDRRLDVLVTRLGLPDRMALREPLPEPVIDATEETIDFTERAAPLLPPAHSLSRRSLIIGGASAVGLAAAGAVGGVFLAGRGDGDEQPTQSDATATPERGASATPAPGAGLDLIERVEDAYERRTFAPGEEIDWAHGIFFMNVDSGEVDGWRLAQALEQELLFTYSLPAPRYIEMLTPDQAIRVLVDRETGVGRKYPAAYLRLVAVAEYSLPPGSRERLLFEVLNGEEGRPATSSGRFIVADEEAPDRITFAISPIQFGPDPLLSLSGDRAVVAADEGDSYGLRLFDLSNGEELAALILPVPTSQRVSINWLSEAPATLRDEFGVEVVLFDEANADSRVLRVWLPWSGNWPAALAQDFDAPRSVFFDPLGGVQLIQGSLRDVPAESLGGGETWPVVEVASRSGELRARIRSASLFYGDGGGAPPWRFAGDWFFTLTASATTEGPGFERVGYTAWHQRTLESVAMELPPPPGSEWFHRTQYRGPIPNPRNLGVVALGRLEAARFDVGSPTPSGRLTNHFVANVTSTSGPDHIDPWCGNPDELVFVIGHGGHDGAWPGAMITPSVEQSPPFDDALRFVVARAGDCVNLRAAPSLDAEVRECLVDGTELTIWPDARGGPEDGVAFVRNEGGAWVAVALHAGSLRAGGALGWVASAYLDWA